ncbi:hypothetical protein [Tellurirhabdus bombi]|uniref:hypothetical protein n=1 Tax=Tellurirhabdus bombi TaxID=2907205 RepID=UPI001F1A6407|nr:hypothetical protein [Tellurirhabdus bombi]
MLLLPAFTAIHSMRGTIIHYDELSQCGLLRDETGQTHYFRHEELTAGMIITDNQTVDINVREESPVQILPYAEAAPVARTVAYVPRQTVGAPVKQSGWLNWPGVLISGLSLIALLLAGGEENRVRGGQTPKLIESIWAILAAILLVIEANFFRTGAKRWRVRAVVWQIVLFSLIAYGLQSCDGFQADDATRTYAYLLGALLVAAYLLPYQRKEDN